MPYVKGGWYDPHPVNFGSAQVLAKAVTVYQHQWGTLVIDEAHKIRTFNRTYMACVELGKLADLRIALSATPGITSPMVSPHYIRTTKANVLRRTSWRSAGGWAYQRTRDWRVSG